MRINVQQNLQKLNKHLEWNNKRLRDRSTANFGIKIRICAFEEKSESYLPVCGQRLTVGSFPQSPSFLSFRYGKHHLWVKLAVIWKTFACRAHQCRCGGGDGLGTVRAPAAKSIKSICQSFDSSLILSSHLQHIWTVSMSHFALGVVVWRHRREAVSC